VEVSAERLVYIIGKQQVEIEVMKERIRELEQSSRALPTEGNNDGVAE
jgi:hypothetical protein